MANRIVKQFLILMIYFVQKIRVSSLITVLFLASCAPDLSDPDPVYEAAIRYYLKSWEQLPAVIVLTIEGENPSDSLLKQLNDLETELVPKDARNTVAPERFRDLSVRKLRRSGIKTFKIEVSSQSEVNGYVDAHGVEYYLRRENGNWVIFKKGAEWMT